MSIKTTIGKLEERRVLKCEVCHGFHTEEESEVIIIKLIKGKGCDLNSVHLAPDIASSSVMEAPEKTAEEEREPSVTSIPPRKSIVPPAFAGLMYPPDHQEFETKGAKERRNV